jgi:hypothetical protein
MPILISLQARTSSLRRQIRPSTATDGDTHTLQFLIRVFSIDAPELHYQGATSTTPGQYDLPFSTFLTAAGKDLDGEFKQNLAKKLINNACTRHIEAGQTSFEHFQALVQTGWHERARKANRGQATFSA